MYFCVRMYIMYTDKIFRIPFLEKPMTQQRKLLKFRYNDSDVKKKKKDYDTLKKTYLCACACVLHHCQ